MKKILFLCRENSARSQIAEGIVNYFYKNKFFACSAGIKIKSIHPLAIEVMKEMGIDISKNRSKILSEFINEEFDYVVTLCAGDKADVCPLFPGKYRKKISWQIEDPSLSNDIEKFRKVRDIIKEKIDSLISGKLDDL